MKTICTYIAIALAAVLQAAYVPTEWQVRVGPKATVYQAERYHGDGLALRATLTDGGLPLPYQGTARLYAQTNGMGAAWWNLADATVSSNVLTATWLPEYDTGADVVDVFLGAPGNYQAHARIRFLPSPGATPGILPLPTPVLNFADVQVLNPPYYTQAETDARILELSPAAQLPGNYLAVSNAAMSAAAQSDLISATNALAISTASALGSYLPLSGGLLTGDLSLSGAASIQYTGVWGVRLYANAGTAGNRIYTNAGDTWQSERGLAWIDETTNLVHAAAVAATNYTDFVIGQFDPPIPVFDVYAEDVTNVSLAVTSSAISTNNQAFVTAVRNVPIAGADASDLAEIAEYGSYGTVGAAILALIAGLAALKRGKVTGALGSGGWVVTNGQRYYVFASDALADDESTIARIGDLRYAKHTLTTPAGAAALLDRAVNKYTGDSTFASCTFTLPPGVDGKVRDFLLDVDNSANGSDVAAEFYGLGTAYALAVNADEVSSSKTAGEVLAEMTVVEAGTRARLYFTEANQTQVATVGNESVDLPILTVQRMTITPTTVQGGAS